MRKITLLLVVLCLCFALPGCETLKAPSTTVTIQDFDEANAATFYALVSLSLSIAEHRLLIYKLQGGEDPERIADYQTRIDFLKNQLAELPPPS